MQAAALKREAIETIGYYVQWKTNEYLGMEWGDDVRRLYIGHLRQRNVSIGMRQFCFEIKVELPLLSGRIR